MKTQTLYSWNVNGIRAAEKKGLLEWIDKTQTDVLCLQETKAHPEQLSKALNDPDGYHVDFNSATIRKGYSGVATYSREVPFKVTAGMEDERFDADGRVLISEFEHYVLFNIYFPNGGRGPQWVTYKLDFYTRFLELFKHYQSAGRSVIVCGDVNTAFSEIDLARPKENQKSSGFLPAEREGLAQFYEAGLVDTFRHLNPEKVQYSWWDMKSRARDRNIGWRIDYFFVSRDLLGRVVEAKIHDDVLGSDHAPISLTIKL
ncbi:exodeoxyribonuclease III [Candidatus Saccharibacteria bacterium]|nr:exodeoxyribonuclease III [Candidatus Saccharibacteria bacterium]